MTVFDTPFRYDLEVPAGGRIEVQLPLPAGSHVTVYVVEQADAEIDDALAANEALSEPASSDVPYEEFRRELGL